MPKKLGLIQSRGIGDIVIALPIAKWYHDRGVEVYWPIDGRFLPSFSSAVDYVRFLPFPFAPTLDGFLNDPKRLLKAMHCDRIVPLYSFLSNTSVDHPAFFATLKFDEYKYAAAGVPFAEKWNLSIRRNPQREQALYERLVRQGPTTSWSIGRAPTRSARSRFRSDSSASQVIEIDERTDCIFDWLLILERARFLLLLDSCFANLVEQLGFPNEKMFILRSRIQFTPVLRSNWQYCGETNPLAGLGRLPAGPDLRSGRGRRAGPCVMLALPTVTLICVDCVNPAAALIALRRSLAQVQFARAVLLTHEAPLPAPRASRW